MAFIPRVNPDVPTPSSLPSVRQDLRLGTGAADAMGRVNQAFAGVVAQVADQTKQREDMSALMKAQRELADWEAAATDENTDDGLATYRGANALAATDKKLGSFDQQAATIRQALTPDQAARFDQIAFGRRESMRNRLESWTQREHDAYTTGERKAFQATMINDAVQAGARGDFSLAAARAQELLITQTAAMQQEGAGPEAIKAYQRAAVSTIYGGIVEGMLAQGESQKAKAFLDQYGTQFDAGTRQALDAKLQPYLLDDAAEAAADAILNGGPVPDLGSISGGQVSAGDRAEPPHDAAQVQAQYADIAKQHGFDITSTTRPVLNIGAGARSQHPKGTAADFRVKGKTREQINALIASLEKAGYEVIDESDGKTGTGPHIHAELPPQRAAGAVQHGEQIGVWSQAPDKATALDRVSRIADPKLRRLAEAKVRDRIQIQEWREADARAELARRLNERIETADPSQSVREILGADFSAAAGEGWIAGYESRLRQRASGEQGRSSPDTVASLQQIVYRATVKNDPTAQQYLRTLNAYDPKLRLTADDRDWVAGAQKAIQLGDSKSIAAAASDAEINQTIGQFGFKLVGVPNADALKRSPAKAEQFNEFNQAMRLWVSDYSAKNNGRKPTYRELLAEADRLTLQVPVLKTGTSYAGFTLGFIKTESEGKVAVAQVTNIEQIPRRFREQIAQRFQKAGRPMTPQAMIDFYRKGVELGEFK